MSININTDDYDMYNRGDTVGALSGTASTEPDQGQLFTPFRDSLFNQEGNERTGDMTDFWTHYPVVIDENGNVLYNNENTGINVRGPAGHVAIRFADLTPSEISILKGEKGEHGTDGANGRDGVDGQDGKSAYQLWLDENGYSPETHPISEFYAYLANLTNILIKEGAGEGSLILNYGGDHGNADGKGALAINYQNNATGDYTFAQGYNTRATSDYQAVFGKYNANNINNILEVGYGTAPLERKNVFEVSLNGDGRFDRNLTAGGEIEDGNNNILSNKVDKIIGKGLSTNDFSNSYKNKLDGLRVDTALNRLSYQPIANKAVAEKVDEIESQYHLLEHSENAAGGGYPLITLEAYPSSSEPTVSQGRYSRNVQYDLSNNAYKLGTLNSWGSANTANLLIGTGLETSEDYQIALGKYNDNQSNNIVEIGYGTNDNNRNNILTIDKEGNLSANSIEDAFGNTLSEKQDLLSYDTEPTLSSPNLVRSGDLLTYLINNGLINLSGNERDQRITALESAVASIQTQDYFFSLAISSITDDITSINSDLSSIHSDISIIDNAINSLDSGIASMSSDITSIYSSVSTISSNITNVNNNITSINSDLTSIHGDITSIQSAIAQPIIYTDEYNPSDMYTIAVQSGAIVLKPYTPPIQQNNE